jgi:hypothetical protein
MRPERGRRIESQITIIFKMKQELSDRNNENSRDHGEESSKTQIKTEFIVKFATTANSGDYTQFSA